LLTWWWAITTRTRTKPAASSLDENVNKTIVDKTKNSSTS
jgi:hypothetical protein